MTTRSSAGAPAALNLTGLVKSFGEQRALDRVELTIEAGTVHALLGENGSGKSTLIKVLSGFYAPDAGELTMHGSAIELPLTPARSASLGLQFVHQDLGLIPSLTAAENFMLGMLSSGESGVLISDRAMQRRTRSILAGYDVEIDPAAPVSSLQPVERALLSIVRAVHAIETRTPSGAVSTDPSTAGRGVLVLDEPTVFLPRKDVERIFTLIRRLAASGCSVLLVSHDLDEVLEVTDAVTVLRDGMVAGSGATASLDRDALIQLIVGRAVDLVTRPKHPTTSTVPPTIALTVDDLASPLVDHIDFTVNRGEILGLTGLAGSGYDQVPYLVYGAKPATSGTAFIQSSIGSSQAFSLEGLFPRAARKLGIGLLPSDRRNTAGVGTLDLIDNVTMLRLDKLRGWIGISRTKMRDDTANLLEDFDVRPRDPSHVFGTLSGGNQQKALLAKWLSSQPQILLIDEPTQGVDIGARSQIFDVLRDAAARGTSVICSSTDHEQLAVLTDRTLIFDKGRIIAELRGDQLTKNSISEACMAGSPSTTAPHPTNGNTTTVQELRP